jgi:emp24/gp25L/p24 family/GOLD
MESFTFQEMVRKCTSSVTRLTPIFNILDVVAPVEREIRSLANGLMSVKDEQEYIVVRERTHRNTAESTNARVKWWSVLQAIVLFSVVAWQVYYLKVRVLLRT